MYRSAHDALKFAYRVTGTPIVKLSSVNPPSPGGAGTTPHDRLHEAANIMRIVEKVVDVNGIAYFKAYYGKELQGGEHERPLADHLVRVVMATMPTGMCSTRGVEKLVRIYFGQDIGMPAVRKDMGCGHAKANEYRDMVRNALRTVGDRAENLVEEALDRAGMIGEDEVAA